MPSVARRAVLAAPTSLSSPAGRCNQAKGRGDTGAFKRTSPLSRATNLRPCVAVLGNARTQCGAVHAECSFGSVRFFGKKKTGGRATRDIFVGVQTCNALRGCGGHSPPYATCDSRARNQRESRAARERCSRGRRRDPSVALVHRIGRIRSRYHPRIIHRSIRRRRTNHRTRNIRAPR